MMDEAMRQALKSGDCEIIPPGARSEKDLRDEMNERSFKKGLTNRQGECCRGTGKIFTTVPFGEPKLNVWPRDENGQLINDD